MSFILILCFLFSCGAIIGWGFELFFRKFFASDNPEHKWGNPGFLTGPYLPLYGFGLCVLYLFTYLENIIKFDNIVLSKACLFLLMMLAMTLLEFIAGEIFVVHMHVKLWDYSTQPGNIKGIICPLFSFFWYILSAIYYFLIHPYILNALAWLSENLAFSFFIGAFYGIFFIDVFYNLKILSKVKAFAYEHGIVIRYEELKAHIREQKEALKPKKRFFFTLKTEKGIKEELKSFWEEKKKK